MSSEGQVKRSASDAEAREERRRKRKSRWGGEETKVIIPGMGTTLPANLSRDQQETFLLHLRVEEVGRLLKTTDLGIPAKPEDRSPSPEPMYDSQGKRVNTREQRTRRKLEDERHTLVEKLQRLNPSYRAPADYRPERRKHQDRVEIPVDEHPEVNFIGMLIGPRGNTLKKMEKESNAKIMIRGKGSVKEGKGRRDGLPVPGEDEPLHCIITGPDEIIVAKGVKLVKEVMKMAIECPDSQNELKSLQLRELAALNGTLREEVAIACTNCGSVEHRHWQCSEKKNLVNNIICHLCGGAGHIARDCQQQRGPGRGPYGEPEHGDPRDRPDRGYGFSGPHGGVPEKNKIDSEYLSFMQELGENPDESEGPASTPTTNENETEARRPYHQGPSNPAPWEHRPAPDRPLMGGRHPWEQGGHGNAPTPPWERNRNGRDDYSNNFNDHNEPPRLPWDHPPTPPVGVHQAPWLPPPPQSNGNAPWAGPTPIGMPPPPPWGAPPTNPW
eukprot:Ihof_evm12s31 gene=Ihof_evmTU12s31